MPRLAVIGASVRALAQSVHRAGWQPVAADQFGDLDLQACAASTEIEDYPQGFLPWLASVKAEAWCYTGGLENEPELVDQLAAIAPLWGHSGLVLNQVRNVITLQACLQSHGFTMPEMQFVPPTQPLIGQWLKKSVRSAGGLRTKQWSPSDEAWNPGDYWQRTISGRSYGASFFASPQHTLLFGIAEQLVAWPETNAPDFYYAGSWGPVILPPEVMLQVQRLGHILAPAFGLRGWFGVDFMVDTSEQLWVLEVNPRYTASMEIHERVHQLPLCRWQAAVWNPSDHATEIPAQLPEAAHEYFGKAVLYARRPGSQITLTGSELLLKSEATQQLADIPADPTAIPVGAPICTVFASASTPETLQHELRKTLLIWQARLNQQ